jgi:hypothetical protein
MAQPHDPSSDLPPQPAAPVPPTGSSDSASNPRPVLEPVTAAAPTVATSPAAPAAPSRRRGGGGGGTAILLVGAIVLVGGLGFAAGRVTAPATSSRAASTGQNGAGNGAIGGQLPAGATGAFRAGGFLGGGGGITVEGTVTAVTADGITLDINGTPTEVKTDASTTYHSQGPAKAGDVSVGTKVLVRMSGFGGRPGFGGPDAGPNASGAPAASAAPAASGAPTVGGPAGGVARTLTATDVTIAAQ